MRVVDEEEVSRLYEVIQDKIVDGHPKSCLLRSTFIIDKSGNRALAANGPREWDSPQAHELFQSLLQ